VSITQLNNSDVFVIVPCYNEQHSILLDVLVQLLKAEYNVVLVDDGTTEKIKLSLANESLHVIRHRINLGQGAALETGTNYALQKKAKYIIHFDADGQHCASDIPDLLNPLLTDNADIVFGSRFLGTDATQIPSTKRILLQIARYINYVFTGILLTDAHNGLRALNLKAASQLRITENRMAHASELLMLVRNKKLRYTEVPVQIKYTAYSLQKGQSIWNSIRIFFDLILHKLFQ
jgi:glycosyltransferase involved in cell wall biosynthesis